MFLLNLTDFVPIPCGRCIFTFHNVSIKSCCYHMQRPAITPLHSTMFLLNHQLQPVARPAYITLHSTMFLLNQKKIRGLLYAGMTLHSTMFLLNPDDELAVEIARTFTFHNVSIKSWGCEDDDEGLDCFTFHNVSIKSPLSSPFLIITPPDCILSTSSSISVSGFSAYVEITVKAAGVRAFQGLSTGCVFCIIRGRQR